MPELPEVQNVIDGLKLEVLNKTVKNVDIKYSRMIEDQDAFLNIVGRTLLDIKRRGKFLIFVFSDDFYLVSHLRMEGKYNYLDKSIDLSKHDHVIFDFGENKTLRYTDVRKFGIMCVRNNETLFTTNPLKKLGYEPFDEKLTYEVLYKTFQKKRIPIKTCLLDQTIMVGLGNIYVDEVLFSAKIHPKRPSNTITKEEVKKILFYTREILELAIEKGGTTIYTFTSSHLKVGTYQNYLKVHTKVNQPCPICSTKIEKIKVGGRSSYFCPSCQKLQVKKVIIGITGGIATGKSNVSEVIRENNYLVIDADEISRKALDYNTICYNEVVSHFGEMYLSSDYTINRQKLGGLIFNDLKAKKALEDIIHPYVKSKMLKQIEESDEKIIFLDIPLLFETNFKDICDKIVCVYLPYDLELKRLIERDSISKELAVKKINSQLDLDFKAKSSDYVIDSSGSFLETRKKIEKMLGEITNG